jgi:predicted nucleotidyltransferase
MPEPSAKLSQASDATEFGLPLEAVAELRKLFAQFPGIACVWIYGSRAKGNYRPGSDIDLSLEAPAMESAQLLEMMQDIDDLLLPYQVDLSLLHHIDNPALREHIARVGQVFWKKL